MQDFWARALTPSAGNRSAALLLGGSASTGSALGAYNLSFAERIVDTVNRALPSSRRLTLSNVAQGSTRTLWALSLFESLWARSTSPDLIIWEYGINDVYLCSERPEEEVEARTKLPGGLSWDETLACTLEVFLRRLSLLPSPPAVLLVFLWPCSLKPHMRRRRYFSVAAPVLKRYARVLPLLGVDVNGGLLRRLGGRCLGTRTAKPELQPEIKPEIKPEPPKLSPAARASPYSSDALMSPTTSTVTSAAPPSCADTSALHAVLRAHDGCHPQPRTHAMIADLLLEKLEMSAVVSAFRALVPAIEFRAPHPSSALDAPSRQLPEPLCRALLPGPPTTAKGCPHSPASGGALPVASASLTKPASYGPSWRRDCNATISTILRLRNRCAARSFLAYLTLRKRTCRNIQ